MAYKILISADSCGSEENAQGFIEWLNGQGHSATKSPNSGGYVDGAWIVSDESARETLADLWDDFCNDQ